MSLDTMQRQTHEWVNQFADGYWPPMVMLARLTEELGELAREVNHRYGPKQKKATEADNEIADKMGDILFTLSCLANSEGIDLDAAFQKTMAKVYGRDNNRFAKK